MLALFRKFFYVHVLSVDCVDLLLKLDLKSADLFLVRHIRYD